MNSYLCQILGECSCSVSSKEELQELWRYRSLRSTAWARTRYEDQNEAPDTEKKNLEMHVVKPGVVRVGKSTGAALAWAVHWAIFKA